jgi:subtilase family serine protease
VEVQVRFNADNNSGDQIIVVNTLAPGQSVVREIEFSTRVPVLSQTIRVDVIADVNNRITEMNENNNAAAFSCRTDIFGQNCR